tara:strand:+ start:10376 stop:11020 length:645 start_codon:yes stop_codon:yes gene_type:complete
MEFKTAPSELKVLDQDEGVVQAFVNSMEVPDADNDIISKDAFNESINGSKTIAVLQGHDQSKVVGKLEDAEVVKALGDYYKLLATIKFNLDTELGRDAFSNVKGGFVDEWSVGFNIPEDSVEFKTDGDRTVRIIKNLDLVEISSVLRGASPETQTISAKSEEEPKTLLEVYTGEKPETPASGTVVETAPDTELELAKARLRLLELESQQGGIIK